MEKIIFWIQISFVEIKQEQKSYWNANREHRVNIVRKYLFNWTYCGTPKRLPTCRTLKSRKDKKPETQLGKLKFEK